MPPGYAKRGEGFLAALWSYFAPAGAATQPYWPPFSRGCLWSFLHGRGWRISNVTASDGGKS